MGKECIKQMDWKEIIQNIGNPVYDKNHKRWRILEGYKRVEQEFCISFTDTNYWVRFQDYKLYLKEV